MLDQEDKDSFRAATLAEQERCAGILDARAAAMETNSNSTGYWMAQILRDQAALMRGQPMVEERSAVHIIVSELQGGGCDGCADETMVREVRLPSTTFRLCRQCAHDLRWCLGDRFA